MLCGERGRLEWERRWPSTAGDIGTGHEEVRALVMPEFPGKCAAGGGRLEQSADEHNPENEFGRSRSHVFS